MNNARGVFKSVLGSFGKTFFNESNIRKIPSNFPVDDKLMLSLIAHCAKADLKVSPIVL